MPSPTAPGVLLLVGTTKGAFLMRSGPARGTWSESKPLMPGSQIYALAYDGRNGRHRLWASTASHFGATLRSSDDFGETWTNPERSPIAFPEDTKATLANIWQLQTAGDAEPDTLYAGVEPAALFVSRDAGASWSLVRGLHDHPHRPKWQPGGGGLALHTIVVNHQDPKRMHIAISAGGVYRTEDGGQSWQVSNAGVRAEFMPDKHPEFGQCVHKVVSHPTRPSTLFLQNHWGLYRSDDAGKSWKDVANGVPSDFGFAMASHPRDPDTVYIIPLESDQFRCVPEGKLRVYRTRDGGGSWQPLAKGLPQKGAFETVLRDGMATDTLAPAGIYFGTRSGKLFGSHDEGATWQLIRDGLPPIVCVKAVTFGSAGAATTARSAARKPAKRKPTAKRAQTKVQAKTKTKGKAKAKAKTRASRRA